jgi:WD40 repeat protein
MKKVFAPGMLLLLSAFACGLPEQALEPTVAPLEQSTAIPTEVPAPTTQSETAEPVLEQSKIPTDLAYIRPSGALALQVIGTYSQLPVLEIAFAPDMQWIALVNTDGLHLHSWPSMTPLTSFRNEEEYSFPYSISADGSTLAWKVQPGELRIASLPSGELLLSLQDVERCCQMMRLSANGSVLAYMDGNIVHVLSVASGEELFTVEGALSFSISPDEKTLATELDSSLSVALWDMSSGDYIRELRGFSTAAPVYSAMFSPNWETMVWMSRASMQFTHVPSGNLGAEFIGSWGRYAPDGDVVVVVEDGWYGDDFLGDVMMVATSDGEQLGVLEHADRPQAIRYSPDGSIIAVAVEDTVTLWDSAGMSRLVTLLNPDPYVGNIFFSPDSRVFFTSSGEAGLTFWGIPPDSIGGNAISPLNAEFVAELEALEVKGPTDVDFALDGSRLAVGTESGTIEIWDWKSSQPLQTLSAGTDWIYQLEHSLDGSLLGVASLDGKITVWDAAEQGLLHSLDAAAGEATSLAFMPDMLMSGHEDGRLRLWDLDEGSIVTNLDGHTDWIWGVAAAPSGDLAASASADGTARLWSVPSGDELHTLGGHASTIWDIEFSPDGATVATSSWDGSILIWDVSTGAPVKALRGHTDWVYGIDFSPNGAMLASASKDGTVRLWDVETGLELHMLEGHTDTVWSVAFSEDGSSLASASSDGTVRIWGYTP